MERGPLGQIPESTGPLTMSRATPFDRLMADVTAGSEEAVWELAETYTPYILRAVRASLPSKVRTKVDSQDFAQTLWASILLKGTDLTRMKSPEQLIAFLARAARNKVIDATRRYMGAQKYDVGREQNIDDLQPIHHASRDLTNNRALATRDPSPSQFASMREKWNQALANASPRDRQILNMRLQGQTFDAISETLEINQATARRAMQRLIEQLSE